MAETDTAQDEDKNERQRRNLRRAANLFGFVYALFFVRLSIPDFMRMSVELESDFVGLQFLFIPFFWVWLYEKRNELPKPRLRFLGLTAFAIFVATYLVTLTGLTLPNIFPPSTYSIDR